MNPYKTGSKKGTTRVFVRLNSYSQQMSRSSQLQIAVKLRIGYSLSIAFQEKLKKYIVKIVFQFESKWFTGNMTVNPRNM